MAMIRWKIVFGSFFILSLSVSQPILLAQRRIYYGINGHPFTQESYKNNTELQIQLLKKMNVKFYRVDVSFSQLESLAEVKNFLKVVQLIRKKNISVLPVLNLNEESYTKVSAEEAFAKGLKLGYTFSQRCKGYFTHYEIGNEEDNKAIIGNYVHGDKTAHFDTEKSKTLVQYIKGICQGIRSSDKNIKLIVNIGWVHYGFLQILVNNGVKFDRVGYHWYSDMGNIEEAGAGFGNVIDTLYKRFKKSIWVTEINVRGGVPLAVDPVKEKWFRDNLYFLRRNKHVESVFIYELLDEPAFGEARKNGSYNVSESSYGLLAWQKRYSQVKEKPFFHIYKKFIQRYP